MLVGSKSDGQGAGAKGTGNRGWQTLHLVEEVVHRKVLHKATLGVVTPQRRQREVVETRAGLLPLVAHGVISLSQLQAVDSAHAVDAGT